MLAWDETSVKSSEDMENETKRTCAPTTVVLRPGSSINTALCSVKSGDRVVLCPGVYRENVVLDQEVELCGSRECSTTNPAWIVAKDPTLPALLATAKKCSVRGLRLSTGHETGASTLLDEQPSTLVGLRQKQVRGWCGDGDDGKGQSSWLAAQLTALASSARGEDGEEGAHMLSRRGSEQTPSRDFQTVREQEQEGDSRKVHWGGDSAILRAIVNSPPDNAHEAPATELESTAPRKDVDENGHASLDILSCASSSFRSGTMWDSSGDVGDDDRVSRSSVFSSPLSLLEEAEAAARGTREAADESNVGEEDLAHVLSRRVRCDSGAVREEQGDADNCAGGAGEQCRNARAAVTRVQQMGAGESVGLGARGLTGRGCVRIIAGECLIANCKVVVNCTETAGVQVMGPLTRPTLQGVEVCRGSVGLEASHEVQCFVQECNFHFNTCGVFVHGGAEPLLLQCQVTANKDTGVCVVGPSGGRYEYCKVYDNMGWGFQMYGHGTPYLNSVQITGNTRGGVEVSTHCNPTVRQSQVTHNLGEAGVWVKDHGRGVWEQCSVSRNSGHGVLTSAGGSPTLKSSVVEKNAHDGVCARDAGAGLLSSCVIRNNRAHGVQVAERGDLSMTDCKVQHNSLVGVFLRDEGKGRFAACVVAHNRSHGMAMASGSAPLLDGVEVCHNGLAGIFAENAGSGGRWSDCKVHDNEQAGIALDREASPKVKRAHVFANGGAGVSVRAKAVGVFEGCEVHGNRTHGFDIASGGNPSLIDTKVHNNAVGVKVYDSGRGTMLNCEVSGNKSYGVEVTTEGHPCAVHTQVERNGASGILVAELGAGDFDQCTVSNNKMHGIEIREGCDPSVRVTSFGRNKRSGIFIAQGGRGMYEQCKMVGNQKGVNVRAGGEPVMRFMRCLNNTKKNFKISSEAGGVFEHCGLKKCSGNHDGRIIENSRSIGGFKSLSGMLLEQLSGRRNVGDCVGKMNTLSDEAVTDCRSKVGNAQLNNWLL